MLAHAHWALLLVDAACPGEGAGSLGWEESSFLPFFLLIFFFYMNICLILLISQFKNYSNKRVKELRYDESAKLRPAAGPKTRGWPLSTPPSDRSPPDLRITWGDSRPAWGAGLGVCILNMQPGKFPGS